MYLKTLSLQNFRNYAKSEFDLNQDLTVVLGPNTSGKTNLLEAIYLLSRGKSFKAEKDTEVVTFDKEIARVKGKAGDTVLEVVVSKRDKEGREGLYRRFLVNNLPKRRVDFAGHFHTLLFSPSHLDIIIGSPGLRRVFFDEVLEPTDRDYRISISQYEKALRARNALLHGIKNGARRDQNGFSYWDGLLIKNAELITRKRMEFTKYINDFPKNLIDFEVAYDKNEMSEDRLLYYKAAEEASGMTLVGPQRDDFLIYLGGKGKSTPSSKSSHLGRGGVEENLREAKNYGSRGQQRLVVLQLKLIQLAYMEHVLGERPMLLLDDIFSELDDAHIGDVIGVIGGQKTVITTTHKEFLKRLPKGASVLELGQLAVSS